MLAYRRRRDHQPYGYRVSSDGRRNRVCNGIRAGDARDKGHCGENLDATAHHHSMTFQSDLAQT
jgi:hypothetical protein